MLHCVLLFVLLDSITVHLYRNRHKAEQIARHCSCIICTGTYSPNGSLSSPPSRSGFWALDPAAPVVEVVGLETVGVVVVVTAMIGMVDDWREEEEGGRTACVVAVPADLCGVVVCVCGCVCVCVCVCARVL